MPAAPARFPVLFRTMAASGRFFVSCGIRLLFRTMAASRPLFCIWRCQVAFLYWAGVTPVSFLNSL